MAMAPPKSNEKIKLKQRIPGSLPSRPGVNTTTTSIIITTPVVAVCMLYTEELILLSKTLVIYFGQKWFGLHFGKFLKIKITWSPCFHFSPRLLVLINSNNDDAVTRDLRHFLVF
jgi:hypothetical protein